MFSNKNSTPLSEKSLQTAIDKMKEACSDKGLKFHMEAINEIEMMKTEKTKEQLTIPADLSEEFIEEAMVQLLDIKRAIPDQSRFEQFFLYTGSQLALDACKIAEDCVYDMYVCLNFEYDQDEWSLVRQTIINKIIYLDEIYSPGA